MFFLRRHVSPVTISATWVSHSSRQIHTQQQQDPVDVAIIGGGVIGSSIAFFLANACKIRGIQKSIAVVEMEPGYRNCATTRSAGSIRHQFTTPQNIQMSQYGTSFLRDLSQHLSVPDHPAPDVSFHEGGYLFLASPEGESILRSNHKIQTELGSDIKLFSPEEIFRKFPWLNISGLSLASLGMSGEGWLDPYSLLMAFRRKAQSLGVLFVKNEVTGLTLSGEKNKITKISLKDGNLVLRQNSAVINSAGTRARNIMHMVGEDIPVRPRKRCIFVFDCPDKSILDAPLLIDVSGVYFRPEGKNYISGVSPPEDKDKDVSPDDFEVDYSLWDETVWPFLAHRVPAFEEIKLVNAWAGHYDLNVFDYNALLGAHPTIKNLYLANGFSGHGLQQSPAVGRAFAELILDGKYTSLDLTSFGMTHVQENKPIVELNIV